MQTRTAPVLTARQKGMVLRHLARALVLLAGLAAMAAASATTCIIEGDQTFGDCRNVQVGPAKPFAVFEGGTHSGNFGQAVIRRRATVTLSGNIDHLVVEPGGRLYFSGNAEDVQVWGFAELTGNSGRVTVHGGGTAVIRGVAQGVAGPGHVIAARGSVIAGVPVN